MAGLLDSPGTQNLPEAMYMYSRRCVATPAGFEPATHGLEGRCSIQLSYGVILSFLHLPLRGADTSTFQLLSHQLSTEVGRSESKAQGKAPGFCSLRTQRTHQASGNAHGVGQKCNPERRTSLCR